MKSILNNKLPEIAIFTGVNLLPQIVYAQSNLGSFNTWQQWAVLLGAVAIVISYIFVLRWLRRRAAARLVMPPKSQSTFSSVELERYSRHIMLREIGGEGQKKLKQTRVAVIGAGGLGSPALFYLAAAGFGSITIIDDDKIELSNLQRQIIHVDQGLGQSKSKSAAIAIHRLNPHLDVRMIAERLTTGNLSILDGHDIVLDGSDNFETRYIVNRACITKRTALISGAISQWEGQVTVVIPSEGSPCLECLFPVEPKPDSAPSCAEAGVMSALPGVVGSMMAAEAIKITTSAGRPLFGQMLIYDALWGETRTIKYDRRTDCQACGGVY